MVQSECIDEKRTSALLAELRRARAWLERWIGPHAAPGSFLGWGVPRRIRPGPSGPVRVDVVVLPAGDRCHADRDGITVVAGHLDRHDATHELVHYLAGSSWRPLDEGLAVYLTERLWGPLGGVPSKIRARVFADLELAKDLDPEELRAGMSRRDYDIAGAFVGWLLEAYPREHFWELYCGPVRNYHGVYGRSEAALWARFWRYVRNLDVRDSSAYFAFKARIARP
ncbi:MAG: hypothetical protein D6731_08315 [Planctomycetota bacterium]|nr:MAG: hypothetical protein D6731_08315 [Planctomycetota bacterium]